MSSPCIIKNAIGHWPAIKSGLWSRKNFIENYGHLKVKAGSRSSIILTSGMGTKLVSIEKFLKYSKKRMLANVEMEHFVFDFSIAYIELTTKAIEMF